MLMLDQSKSLGQLHNDYGSQSRDESQQIGLSRQDDQSKGNPHRYKQNKENKEEHNTIQAQFSLWLGKGPILNKE